MTYQDIASYSYLCILYLCVLFRSSVCLSVMFTRIYVEIWINSYIVVLGNILVVLLHRGIEFIPVTLLRKPLYQCYIFLWLRGGHDIVNRVVIIS